MQTERIFGERYDPRSHTFIRTSWHIEVEAYPVSTQYPCLNFISMYDYQNTICILCDGETERIFGERNHRPRLAPVDRFLDPPTIPRILRPRPAPPTTLHGRSPRPGPHRAPPCTRGRSSSSGHKALGGVKGCLHSWPYHAKARSRNRH